MGRVYFPTKNELGVRTMSGYLAGDDYVGFRAPAEPAPRGASNPVNLGAIMMANGGDARSEMIRVPIYGRVPVAVAPAPIVSPIRVVGPITYTPAPTVTASPLPAPPQGPAIQAPASPAPVAPPVSLQTSPTPVVTIPPTAPTNIVSVTSGGGTAAPAIPPVTARPAVYATDASGNIVNAQTGAPVMTASQAASSGVSAASMNAGAASTPAAAAPAGITDQIAAWLGGTTPIFSYNVPNAILAGAVVLGFAMLEGGSGKRR
jgi:hypothetical protein